MREKKSDLHFKTSRSTPTSPILPMCLIFTLYYSERFAHFQQIRKVTRTFFNFISISARYITGFFYHQYIQKLQMDHVDLSMFAWRKHQRKKSEMHVLDERDQACPGIPKFVQNTLMHYRDFLLRLSLWNEIFIQYINNLEWSTEPS